MYGQGIAWGYELGQTLYTLGTGTDPTTGRELTDKEYRSLVAGLLGSLVGGAIAGFAVKGAQRINEVAAGERCSLFGSCFVAGTPMDVLGGSKPIEQVRDAETHGPAADRVRSRNQFDPDGPVVARRVLRRFVRVSPVLDLDVGGRRIGTTREHPFYAEAKGWTPAGELAIGDRVLLKSGGWLRVDGVADSGRVETVYNLEVEGDHTYFVGGDDWGFAVWAHNADCSIEKTGPESYELRDRDGNLVYKGKSLEEVQEYAKANDHTVERGPYRGGAHSEMSGPDTTGDALDSHHMPDRRANPEVHPDDGPAIQMDPPDHWATSSNGRNGPAGARYRNETAQMIRDGRYRDAMAREIRDVRRAANEVSGNARKYNEAIREMLDYARRTGQLPGR